MAPFFEQKHKLWVLSRLDSASTVSLTLTDPLPSSVLRYLRIHKLFADYASPDTMDVLQLTAQLDHPEESFSGLKTKLLRDIPYR
jgi:hypothetical protein